MSYVLFQELIVDDGAVSQFLYAVYDQSLDVFCKGDLTDNVRDIFDRIYLIINAVLNIPDISFFFDLLIVYYSPFIMLY